MNPGIDINGDVGEQFGRWTLGNDASLLPLISSASVACGFHAGDWRTIDATIRLCKQHDVVVGAHPSFPDLQGFGRRLMVMDPDDVEAMVIYQLGAVAAFCRTNDVPLKFVKAHGALYNQAADDDRLALAIAQGVARFDSTLALVGLAGSAAYEQAARSAGVRLVAEGFADRGYLANGRLAPRSHPEALHQEMKTVAAQALAIAEGRPFPSIEGPNVLVKAETICFHGDTADAAELVIGVLDTFDVMAIQVRSFI